MEMFQKIQNHKLTYISVLLLILLVFSPKTVFGIYQWGNAEQLLSYFFVGILGFLIMIEFFITKSNFATKILVTSVFIASLLKCLVFIMLFLTSKITIDYKVHLPLLLSLSLLIVTGISFFNTFFAKTRIEAFIVLSIFTYIFLRLYLNYFALK